MSPFSFIFLSAELEEAHNYDTTISYLSHFSNSINFCAAGESAEGKSAKANWYYNQCGKKCGKMEFSL